MVEKTRAISPLNKILLRRENKKKNRSRFLFVASFLVLPIINFIIFYIYVNLDSFVMAFQTYDTTTMSEVFTINNFTRIWEMLVSSNAQNALIKEALLNTLLFFGVNTLIVMPLTLFLCYFLYKKVSGYRFYRAVIYMPCIIASSALVALYKISLGNGGLYEFFVNLFGGTYTYPFALDASYGTAMTFIMIYNVVFGIGGNIIVISGAMNAIDKEVLEASQIDGCNWLDEFIRIILPSIWPTLSTIIILSVASFLGSTGPILAFDQGSHQTHTLSFYIFALVSGMANETHGEYLASAIGLCMTVISFPLALIVKRVVYGKEK